MGGRSAWRLRRMGRCWCRMTARRLCIGLRRRRAGTKAPFAAGRKKLECGTRRELIAPAFFCAWVVWTACGVLLVDDQREGDLLDAGNGEIVGSRGFRCDGDGVGLGAGCWGDGGRRCG